MIQLKNIERNYKTGAGYTWVLRRVNLDIQQGEFITVMGPSGAGKSSLLKRAGASRRPVDGRILVARGSCSRLEAQATK